MGSKQKIFLIGGIAAAGIILILLVIVGKNRSKSSIQPSPGPVKHLKDFDTESIHGDNPGVPDIREELLPDGRKIQYGSKDGMLSPLQEQELQKIIEKEKQKSQPNSPLSSPSPVNKQQSRPSSFFFDKDALFSQFFAPVPLAAAAGLEDTLIIEMDTPDPVLDAYLRAMFRNHLFYWTDRDLGALEKIMVIDNKSTMGGALGAWNFARIDNPDGSFSDLRGIMWLWRGGPIEEALIHEYGHHYTNYWAGHRTNGAWETTNLWPIDTAGDYYTLRPLPSTCNCGSFDANVCPYQNRVWEIIAEDYRLTASVYNTTHIFADAACLTGGGKVGQPDLPGTSAYLAALPLSGGAVILTPAVLPPSLTPTPTPVICYGVQHCSVPGDTKPTYCGDCQGANCTPGNTCPDPGYRCTTYRTKVHQTDTLYPIPCSLVTPSVRPTFAVEASYFPKTPFTACYNRGGVCTYRDTCLRFKGTVYERDTTICPNAEGCCIFPDPVPIAPTQTPCETEGGICTNFTTSCTAQGGTIDGAKGCSNQCCKFASLSTKYTNQDYLQIIGRVKEGTVGPLAISAWVENACRTPGLQTVSCDPNKDGDCERLQCVR